MPLDEAPETTESAVPSGTAGAITPGTGTLAGASIALVGTLVPSGNAVLPPPVPEAVALALTRLAVHTPDISASGTKATALLRRDRVLVGLLVMCELSPLGHHDVGAPQGPTKSSTTVPQPGHAQTLPVTQATQHTARPSSRGAA